MAAILDGQEAKRVDRESLATVAVVAIGRNEGERLIRCLESLPPGLRAIYVDSASTDDSIANARARGAVVVPLDMSQPFTAARARNAGLVALAEQMPDAAYVQFVDGDCEIEAGWLETAAAWLDTHGAAAVVCGRRRERHPEASVYNRLCDAEWDTPVGLAMACGGDAMMRLAMLRGVGGYDEAVVAGEEPELCARLRAAGGEIWRIDAPMTIHDAAITRLGQYWRRAVRGGFGFAQTWRLRGLYGRELARALFWGGALPVATLALALLSSPGWLALMALPALQVIRQAVREGGSRFAWQRAGLLMLAKYAEALGALRYVLQAARARPRPPGSYK